MLETLINIIAAAFLNSSSVLVSFILVLRTLLSDLIIPFGLFHSQMKYGCFLVDRTKQGLSGNAKVLVLLCFFTVFLPLKCAILF